MKGLKRTKMTKTELLELLKDARKVLSMAFFADYHLQLKSDEVVAKIDKFMNEKQEVMNHERIKY